MKILEKSSLVWAPAALLLTPLAEAEVMEQTALMIIQQNMTTEMEMNFFPSNTLPAETTRTYTGNFSCSFEFDTETLQIEGFKFNGGTILISAYGLQCSDFITYPQPTNTQFTIVTKAPYLNVANGVIQLSPETRENSEGEVEFGDVDSEGQLTNSNYKYFASQGIYTTSFVIRGAAQDTLLINYNQGVNLLYKGTSTVDIREVSSTIYEKSVRAYLTIELDEDVVTTLQGRVAANNIDIIETEKGTIVANTGQFKVPTAYGNWATENDLNKPDPDDVNEAGIAYGILFALDLPADATSLPISTENTDAGPVTKIVLPEGGLLSPMAIEYTTELDNEDWPLLPTTYYLDGPDSLNLGATGEPSFGFPDGERCFVRFVTDLD
ncbi:hypothetical protein [Haloferula sp.]|uniref:hypothetical protein n=1 Tax=Haloferula sp. TaxID=2497595 RepID=UPI003C77CB9B